MHYSSSVGSKLLPSFLAQITWQNMHSSCNVGSNCYQASLLKQLRKICIIQTMLAAIATKPPCSSNFAIYAVLKQCWQQIATKLLCSNHLAKDALFKQCWRQIATKLPCSNDLAKYALFKQCWQQTATKLPCSNNLAKYELFKQCW